MCRREDGREDLERKAVVASNCACRQRAVWSTTKEFGPLPLEDCWEGFQTRTKKRCISWRNRAALWAAWADSFQMIHQRTQDVATAAECRLSGGPLMGVWRNSEKRRQSWNEWALGGNLVGRNFAMARDRHRTTHVTLVNGRTARNIGHPLFLTPISGGSVCSCTSTEHTSGSRRTVHSSHLISSHLISSHLISSHLISLLIGHPASRRAHLRSFGAKCWHCVVSHTNGTRAHPSRLLLLERFWPSTACHWRHGAAGATNHLIFGDATSPLVQGPAGLRSVPPQLNGCWQRFAGRLVRVRYNTFLRDMNVHVLANDSLRFWPSGAQLAVDITLRSGHGGNLHRIGDVNAMHARGGAIETGGRWSEEVVQFIWQLAQAKAQAKAQDAPRFLTQQFALWERHWTGMLSTVCASSFAASLVETMSREMLCRTEGDLPTTADVLFMTFVGAMCD